MVWKCEKVIYHRLPTRKIKRSNVVDRKMIKGKLRMIRENFKRGKAHEVWLEMNVGTL